MHDGAPGGARMRHTLHDRAGASWTGLAVLAAALAAGCLPRNASGPPPTTDLPDAAASAASAPFHGAVRVVPDRAAAPAAPLPVRPPPPGTPPLLGQPAVGEGTSEGRPPPALAGGTLAVTRDGRLA